MNIDRVLFLITTYPYEFSLGYEEADSAFGMTYDDDPESDRSAAYDLGRSLALGMHVA